MLDTDSPNPSAQPYDGLYCPRCTYDLRGSAGNCCPECGYSLLELRAGACLIPWVHRSRRARIAAFWQTVWLVTFSPQRFCAEFSRRVEYHDARRFQWTAMVHAYVPLLLATAYLYASMPRRTIARNEESSVVVSFSRPGLTFFDLALAEVWPVVLLHACFVAFLFTIGRAASLFFRPTDIPVPRQNSAVAMSLYASGSLAWSTVVFLGMVMAMGAACYWTEVAPGPAVAIWLHILAMVSLGLTLLVVLWSVVSLGRRIMPLHGSRWLLMTFSLPVIWLAMGVFLVVLMPSSILYLLLVAFSLVA